MLTRGPVNGAALLAMAAMTAAGCGGGSHFENKPRPPVPVQLTGVITDKGVTISPDRVGSGPIVLLISNETQQAHTITLDGENTQDTVGPINPLDTAKLQQTVEQGTYQVKAGSSKAVTKQLKPGNILVGPPRKDSSDQVQLP
jgi:hypothetical protein